VRSLRRLPSLQATLISNAANMCVTGAAGFAAFSEPLGARWLAGIACVLCGLMLISKASIGSSRSSGGGAAQSPAARPRTRAATRAAKEE
jgi:drug/metabolite transporter (DMT)-like permease